MRSLRFSIYIKYLPGDSQKSWMISGDTSYCSLITSGSFVFLRNLSRVLVFCLGLKFSLCVCVCVNAASSLPKRFLNALMCFLAYSRVLFCVCVRVCVRVEDIEIVQLNRRTDQAISLQSSNAQANRRCRSHFCPTPGRRDGTTESRTHTSIQGVDSATALRANEPTERSSEPQHSSAPLCCRAALDSRLLAGQWSRPAEWEESGLLLRRAAQSFLSNASTSLRNFRGCGSLDSHLAPPTPIALRLLDLRWPSIDSHQQA